MKIFPVLVAASSLVSTAAFAPAARSIHQSTQLNIVAKGKASAVKKSIKGLTKDNFDSTLSEIEPFLTKEAGRTIYTKSMRRIAVKADVLGVSIPADFAKDAQCTQKRREKQDAYCKAKVSK